MSRSHIPKSLRELVAEDSGSRCGYCLSSQAVAGMAFEMDHVFPESLGGRTERENLWLCCGGCNDRKGNRTSAIDNVTGKRVRLFHPRVDDWTDHFQWTQHGEIIEGRTPIGRATVVALGLNRPLLVAARREWIGVGWHPPKSQRRVRRRPR